MPDNTPTIFPANATFKSMFLEEQEGISPLYYVPNYQRYYAWEEPQIKQFLDDLTYCVTVENEDRIQYQHFLGQVIMRNAAEKNVNDGFKYFEIIDGQQRITTFLMLCLVIFRNLKIISDNNPTMQAQITEKNNIIKKIIFKGQGTDCRLTLSNNDNEYWKSIIVKYTRNYEIDLRPRDIVSQKRMTEAIIFIDNYFNDLLSDGNDNVKKETLLNYFVALTERMHIITVTSEPREYMFSLFQTVNDRGRLLTNGELLKAKTLESLRLDENKQETAETYWNDILSDDGKKTDQYLEWCLITYTGEQVDKKKSLYHQFIEAYFIESQSRHLNEPQMATLLSKIKELSKDIQSCRTLSSAEWPFEDDERPNWQKQRLSELIRRMRHNKCIPIFVSLIYMYRTLPHNATDHQKKDIYDLFYNVLDIIDRFFFVYIKVCDADENNFRNAYAKYSHDLRSNNACALENIIGRLKRIMNSAGCANMLETYLDQSIYSQKKTHVQEIHLLYLLEIYYTNNLDADLVPTIDDAINIDVGSLSVEHIYAKRLPIDQQNNEMEQNKQKLGNLTLLGKNQNQLLENKQYTDKITSYDDSSYRITKNVAQNPDWTLATFNSRHSHLRSLAKKIFTL